MIFSTCNQPEGPPCGTDLKNNYFAARNEDDGFLPSIYCLSSENLKFHAAFCLRYVWRNIQGYGMRTAIRDIAEGADMGLETGSVPGLSCSLYGGVDFEEDDREVTGWSAVGKEAIPADVDMGKTTRTCNAEGAGEPSPQPEPLSCRIPA